MISMVASWFVGQRATCRSPLPCESGGGVSGHAAGHIYYIYYILEPAALKDACRKTGSKSRAADDDDGYVLGQFRMAGGFKSHVNVGIQVYLNPNCFSCFLFEQF